MSKIFTLPHRPIYDGAEPHDFTTNATTGDHNLALGLRTDDVTQRYVFGTRHITWDGRVFKYSHAVAACYSYHGARASEAAALSWTVNAVETGAGERSCTVPVGSRTVDDLAGAYLMIYNASLTDCTWLFGIVGNEASVSTTTIVYLDGAIPEALTTSDYFEVFENPYREASEVTNGYSAWIGVPATNATILYNFWLQSWGPAYISPVNATLDDPALDERTVFWGNNAGIGEEAHTGITTANQYAGYILNQGTAVAGPLIMLMCST